MASNSEQNSLSDVETDEVSIPIGLNSLHEYAANIESGFSHIKEKLRSGSALPTSDIFQFDNSENSENVSSCTEHIARADDVHDTDKNVDETNIKDTSCKAETLSDESEISRRLYHFNILDTGHSESYPDAAHEGTNHQPKINTKQYAQFSTIANEAEDIYADAIVEPLSDNESESDDDISINQVDEDGDTFLHSSIIADDVELSMVLVPLMAEVDAINVSNDLFQTPLHLAVLIDQPSVIRELITHGASTALQDGIGRTALHIACEKGNIDLLTILLKGDKTCLETDSVNLITTRLDRPTYNALDIRNYDGEACLHIATKNGDVVTIELLLKHGADINLSDGKSKRSALHFAAEKGDEAAVEVLLQHDEILVDSMTMDNETPLEFAILRGHETIKSLILSYVLIEEANTPIYL